MADLKWEAYAEAAQTALSTDLNSLADGSAALSSAIDNTSTLNTFMDLELVVTYGTAPAGEQACEIWVVSSADGTNYEDGSGSVTPARPPDAIFALRAVTSAQRIVIKMVPIPPALFKILLVNEAGQTMAASGNTVKYRRYNMQSV